MSEQMSSDDNQAEISLRLQSQVVTALKYINEG